MTPLAAEHQRALEGAPDSAPSQLSRALVHHDEGRFEQVVELFGASLRLDPPLWVIKRVRFGLSGVSALGILSA